jgi:malate/lactate dehydrogenase
MSGAQTAATLNPQPERWGAMRAGNYDSRTRDTTPDLAQLGDTITAILCSVARRDGLPMTSQDLTWAGTASVDATMRVVTVMLAVGYDVPLLTVSNPIDYLVTITVQTAGGRTLAWDTYQLVVAQIG